MDGFSNYAYYRSAYTSKSFKLAGGDVINFTLAPLGIIYHSRTYASIGAEARQPREPFPWFTQFTYVVVAPLRFVWRPLENSTILSLAFETDQQPYRRFLR